MSADVVDLVLDAPARNALSSALMGDVLARVRAAGDRPILLRSAGPSFCAGLDLKEVASLDVGGMARFLGLLESLMETLYCHPAPVVAAVAGHAIAGGCVLTLCADHRVLIDDPAVRIGLNEVALGLQYPPKLFTIVRRRVAPRSLERVVLEAGLYDPRTALALGVVDELAADPLAVARAHLGRLAAHPHVAFAATKRALRGRDIPLDAPTQRWFEDELIPSWCAPDVKARVTARLKK